VVSIIIPVYNALEYARECLDSVYRAMTGVPFEVIVVDNGSDPVVAAWLSAEQVCRHDLQVLHFELPLGFARAVNEGARTARFGFLVLLNSDAAVTDGWLDSMVRAMETDPRLGIVSPVTNHSGPGAQLVSEQSAAMRESLIYEPQRLFFYCVMIRRELWDSLDGLDEIYEVGTYEDDDFCLRTRMAGWSLAVVPNAFVWNHESRTFRENHIDRNQWIRRNREIFFDRASRLSRTPLPAGAFKPELPSVTVVVPVTSGAAANLLDSLTSLANQTVRGFETILATRGDVALPAIPDALADALRLRPISAPGGPGDPLDILIDAGIAAATGNYLSYLPAGDIYYPYHLEVLHGALNHDADGAACGVARTECRIAPSGRTEVVPPICWMHRRARLREKTGTLTLPRVTCETGVQFTEIDTQRRRTGHRARQLLVRTLAARPGGIAIPRTGLPDIFMFNIIGWEALTQRPHHFAKGLVQRGYRVYWIDVKLAPPAKFLQAAGPLEPAANLFHLQLPGPAGDIYHLRWNSAVLELMTEAMRHLRSGEGVGRAVQLVNFPGWTPLVEQLRQRLGWPILYDCLDDQHAFGDLYSQQTTSAFEEQLTGICDVLVTSGLTLYETKRQSGANAILIPNAADYPLFSAAVSTGLLDRFPRPIIGFFGAFADWLDLVWISEAARRFPPHGHLSTLEATLSHVPTIGQAGWPRLRPPPTGHQR
jgi:GT2 family glycosyltransferase